MAIAITATQLLSPNTCSSNRPQISSCNDRSGESRRLIQRDGPALPLISIQTLRELISPSISPSTQLKLHDIRAVIRVICSPVSWAESTLGSSDGWTAANRNPLSTSMPPPCRSRTS